MQNNKAVTSAMIVGVGSLVLLAGFFLPWMRIDLIIRIANVSGLSFAATEIYLWLLPVVALVGLGWAIYIVNQGTVSRDVTFIAGGSAILAILGSVIFLVRYNQNIMLTSGFADYLFGTDMTDMVRDAAALQYGFWGTFIGAIGMLLGAGIAFTADEYSVQSPYPIPPTQAYVPTVPPPSPQPAPMPTMQPTVPQPAPHTVSAPSPQSRQATQQMGVPAAAEGWLVLRTGPRVGQQFGLTRGRKNTIGRDPQRADIVVDSNKMSGEHARIQCESDQFYIYDLASTNGTFVNNRRIQRQMLMDGDIVQLGDMQFVFKRVA